MIDQNQNSEFGSQLIILIDALDLMDRYIPYLGLLFDDNLGIETQRIILGHYSDSTQSAIEEMRSVIEKMRSRLRECDRP